MKKNTDVKNITHFLYEVGTLRRLTRVHQQVLFEHDLTDNIASHSYRVSIIGWVLAKMEKADPYKVVTMCLFHDLAEARSNDHNWVHKKYVKVFEDEITKDQLNPLPWKDEMSEVMNDYEERESLEAKVAKDADLLDQILLLKEYEHKGNKEAPLWLKGQEDAKRFFTKSAKALVKEMMAQTPSDWWKHLSTNINR